jgi:Raf kinase inhibitor-like YbhB/YbcL family protein
MSYKNSYIFSQKKQKKWQSIYCAIFLLWILSTIFLFNMEAMAMEISSSVFSNGDAIPKKYSCEGEGISPELSISNVPEKAKSLVLIVDDPDAPLGTWTHWVLYNLPTTTTVLKENIRNLPDGTEVGLNSWSKQEYGGPCPPSGEHRYFFKLFALDSLLEFSKPPTGKALQKAMSGHVLAEASLVGKYQKNK